ncbi:hypothetical protein AKJ16_DCAP08800 [Drosera capensis]
MVAGDDGRRRTTPTTMRAGTDAIRTSGDDTTTSRWESSDIELVVSDDQWFTTMIAGVKLVNGDLFVWFRVAAITGREADVEDILKRSMISCFLVLPGI